MLWVSFGNIPANFLQGHWQRCSTPFAINDFCNYSWDLPKWNWWSILCTTIFKWHIGRHTIYSKLGFDLYHLVERCSPTQFSNLSAAFYYIFMRYLLPTSPLQRVFGMDFLDAAGLQSFSATWYSAHGCITRLQTVRIMTIHRNETLHNQGNMLKSTKGKFQ